MPVVEVTLVKDVFSSEQKHAMARKITDAMAEVQGSEAFRELVTVLINELEDGYHLGGEALDAGKVEKAVRTRAAI